MGLEKDLRPGEQLVILFRPFLEHLAASDPSPKTIQQHVDNMCALGGEFIRDLNDNPALRKEAVERVLSDMIEYGGRFSMTERRSAEIVRLHMQEVPSISHRNSSLTLAVTHNFPDEAFFKTPALAFSKSPIHNSYIWQRLAAFRFQRNC